MFNFFKLFKRRQRKRSVIFEVADALNPDDYIPRVTFDDVQRIVRRDFPANQVDAVLNGLNEYGSEAWHRERYRVYLAILKLSNGNIDEMREQLEVAKSDYRELLSPAESPAFFQAVMDRANQLTKEEFIELRNAEREQYNTWMNRSAEASHGDTD